MRTQNGTPQLVQGRRRLPAGFGKRVLDEKLGGFNGARLCAFRDLAFSVSRRTVWGVGLFLCLTMLLEAVPEPGPLSERIAQGGRESASTAQHELPAGLEIRIRLVDTLSTKRNARGDSFLAEVTEDVKVDSNSLLRRGALVTGTITRLKRAGRISGRAEINLRFDELRFENGARAPLEASMVRLTSPSGVELNDEQGIRARRDAPREAGAVGTSTGVGTLVGGIKGGSKGAAVGAGVGAMIGLAGILATRGRDVELGVDTEITLKLLRPIEVPEILVRSVR
jgi:hypothetical protein